MTRKLLLLLAFMPFIGFSQFVQNFDAGTTIPTGWTVINGGDANTWTVIDFSTSTTLTAHSGSKAVGIAYGSTAHDDYLVTPAIAVTAGVSDYLTFWGRSRDPLYPEQISVKISTTIPNALAFTNTLAANIAPASGANFYKYQYDLSAYAGQTIYIGFHSETTDKFYFDIDDVEITAIPSCLEPVNPIVVSTTVNSSNLSWTSSLSSFEVEYGAPNFVLGTGTAINNITATTATINGLTANTSYEYYVRSNCGSSNYSVWVGPISFKTPCDAVVTFPFVEGFDSGAIPSCWSNSTVIGSTNWTYVSTNGNNSITPRTGAGMAEFRTSTSGNKTKLVTPPLDLTGVTSPQLEFYYANVNWVGDIDELRIFYRTSATGAWVQIGSDYITENATWTQVVLPLPNPTATYYIAFEGTSNWARGLNLDDVTISGPLSNTNFDTASLNIYPNPTKDYLNISYKDNIKSIEVYNLLGQQVMIKNINSNETSLNLSELASGTYLARIITEDGLKTVKVVKE